MDTKLLGTHPSERPLLQRRNNITTPIQAALDGLLVILLVVGLTMAFQGVFTLSYTVMTLALMGAMGVAYDRFGVYRHHGGMTQKALTLGKAWSVSFAFLLLLGFLTKSTDLYSRTFTILLYLLGYLVQLLSHMAFLYLRRYSAARRHLSKALIVGTGQLANFLSDRINNNPWMPEHVIGTIAVPGVENPEGKNGEKLPPNLGEIADLKRLIAERDVETIYIAVSLDSSPIIREIYFDLLDANVNIHWAPNIFALNLINHSVKELAGIPILTLSETPLIGSHLLLKGIEDKLIASIGLIMVSPIMLATAIAIKLESPGPVFFRQARTGWDGREFKIWKFRSMRSDLPDQGVVKQATKDDPRITRVGRFIRRTSIDELPQLFNVLTGQMSLVGPRPHAVQHNRDYSERIVAYLARHRIKPGITGLAQVRGYRGETKELEQMKKRVEYDLEYINNWSVWLDLSIIMRTFLTLFNKNAY